jgi:hypothetical protein
MAKAKKSVRKAAAPKPAAKPAAPVKKNGTLFIVLAAIVAVIVLEIYVGVQNTIRQGKRPDYVTAFPNEYKKGLTSLGLYGNFLYGIDNTNGLVYKTNKSDGKLVKVYQVPEQVYFALEDSRGMIYILDKQNTVQEYSPDDKLVKKIKLEGFQNASWMDVDSKDNFYVVDSFNSTITKFDPSFNKVASFAGKGSGNQNFVNLGKIFVGPGDNLYCLNMIQTYEAHVKILDSNGKFVKEWPIKNMVKFSNLENLAITKDGHIYINSFEGSSIHVFDSNGKYMGSFDTDLKKSFLITYPSSLAGGKDGLLYIPTHDLAVFKTMVY